MFNVGFEYTRTDLLAFVGSKQTQTGIIWGNKEQGCVIVSSGGRHGKKAGYRDTPHDNGSWTYFGQGEKGDHNLNKFSNKILINKQHTVLLFSTKEPSAQEAKKNGNWKKAYTYQGVYEVLSHEIFIPAEGSRKGDKLIKFHLIPAGNIIKKKFQELDVDSNSSLTLEELRKQVIQGVEESAMKKTTIIEYRKRSQLTKNYALLRANGICEFCNYPAPFLSGDNHPYLEVHNILRLADDGPDLPQNVAAICPNCHSEAHYGINKIHFKETLLKKVIDIESAIFQ